MKRLFLLLIICSLACIISCNKPSSEPIPPTPAANGLLKKTFYSKSSSDSIVSNYSYNADNTLDVVITTTYNIVTTPSSHTNVSKYYWRDQQRLKSVAVKDQNQTDTTYTYYFYENSGSTKPFSSSTKYFISPGIIVYDSVLYTYDVAGNSSKTEHYSSSNWPTLPISKSLSYLSWKNDVNGNVAEKEYHNLLSTSPATDTIVIQQLYKYDNKNSPYKNIPDYLGLFQSNNNVIEQKSRNANVTQGGYDEIDYAITYTFDNKQRPGSSVFYPKNNPSDISTTYFYYYD